MRIFLITGFALDKRAFSPLNLPAEPFHLVDLVPAKPEESLRDYALRMAADLGVTKDDVVGGVSFGGMLALEMAKAIGARGLILIASCTHPRFIRRRFLWLAPIARYLPEAFVRKVFTLVPAVLRWQNMLDPAGQALLADIMGHFPPKLLKTLPYKMLHWEGCEASAPLKQIHSTGDWLIRPNGDPALRITLPGPNHLITVSHPAEVRRFLMEAAREFGATISETSATTRA
jgi:pimeloyl-ACP methyl ester carboxylesterase